MRIKFLRTLVVLMIILCLVVPANMSALAKNSSPDDKVISVFYPLQPGFSEKNNDGTFSGYSYEYLMKIAQLTGWKYEFVVMEETNENLMSGLKMVENGEIDICGAMTYSSALAEKYSFCPQPYGEGVFTLISRSDFIELNERTISDFPNIKIALIEDATYQNGIVDEYFKLNNLTYEPVYVKSNLESSQMLQDCQVDAIVSKDISKNIGFRTIAKFESQPFYFASSHKNKQLLNELSDALKTIDMVDPFFKNKLHEKYFYKSADYDISLTTEEREYIKSTPKLRVAFSNNSIPLNNYNSKTDQYTGITIDVLNKISKKCDLSFEYVYTKDIDELNELVKAGKVDIIAGVPYYYSSPEELLKSNLLLTSPIYSAPIIRLYNPSIQNERADALVDTSAPTLYNQSNVVYESNIENILRMVNKGQYEQAYVNGYTAQHYLKRQSYKNIISTAMPYGNYEICLGVIRGEDLRLVSILEQSISTITSAEIEDIVYQNTAVMYQESIWDIIRRDPLQFLTPIIFLLIIIMFLLLVLFIKTRRANKAIAVERSEYKNISRTDMLTQTYNNVTFKHLVNDFLNDSQINPCGTFIILDIDNFKSINDNYGHLEGDNVLCSIGALLKSTFNDIDVIGRLGGDEFTILMKNIYDLNDVKHYLDKLKANSITLTDKCDITLSIGATTFCKSVSFDSLLTNSDAMLYEVKKQGKNNYMIYSNLTD